MNYCRPHRSAQTSASVGADIRIGRRGCYFVMFYKSFSSTSR
ncbi:hypothetical protein [Leyella stercorea]|nr:hypothetical protein [Leyella stercorea]